MQSPKLLAKSPSHSLNAEMLSLKILMLLQFAPPPQLLHPPGLHLPGCSPPLQLPGPGHCRAGYLHPGQKQTCQTIDTPNAQSWSPNRRRKIGTKTVSYALSALGFIFLGGQPIDIWGGCILRWGNKGLGRGKKEEARIWGGGKKFAKEGGKCLKDRHRIFTQCPSGAILPVSESIKLE